MGDLFHDDVPIRWLAEVWNVMSSATVACGKRHEHEDECWTGPPHTFQVLTKRPERMLRVLTEELPDEVGSHWPDDSPISVAMEVNWPLPNVWLGVTAENQACADKRIPLLLECPAALHFVSLEPLLGPIDLRMNVQCEHEDNEGYGVPALKCLNWVIVGCETGPGARPMDPDWARSVRDQCQEAGVPFFLKKLTPGGVRELDGRLWEERP
jgi:protein gp37